MRVNISSLAKKMHVPLRDITIIFSNNFEHQDTSKKKHALTSLFKFCQRHGQAVPRAGDRSYVTGSIRGWSRSHLTYITGGCSLEERKLTSQSPSITVEFSVQYNLKIASVIYYYYLL